MSVSLVCTEFEGEVLPSAAGRLAVPVQAGRQLWEECHVKVDMDSQQRAILLIWLETNLWVTSPTSHMQPRPGSCDVLLMY